MGATIRSMAAPRGPAIKIPRWIQLVGLPVLLVLGYFLASTLGHALFLFLTAAMIAFLLQLNEQERTKQEQQQAKNKKRHHKDQPKRKRLTTPEHLARTITQMVQDLGGNPQYLQSDITRLTKMYWACTQIFTGFHNVWFLEQLTKAFVKTCKARKVSKRVPYFFKTLEQILELTNAELAYIRSQEPLYRDGDLKTFVQGLEQGYHRSGSQLEFQHWVEQTYL